MRITSTCFAGLLTILMGCTPENECVSKLEQMVPAISNETARHLLASPDSVLFDYLDHFNQKRIRDIAVGLYDSVAVPDPALFTERRACAVAPMKRMWRYMHRDGEMDAFFQNIQRMADLTGAEGARYAELRNRLGTIWFASMPWDEKISELSAMAVEMEGLGMRSGKVYSAIAGQYANIDSLETAMRFARKMIAAGGTPATMCQTMGVLGVHWKGAGEVDSMEFCYDLALELAYRYRVPDQIARIHRFKAAHLRGEGQMSLAKQQLDRGLEECVEYGGGVCELRERLHLAEFYAALSDWRNVHRLVNETRSLRLYIEEFRPDLNERIDHQLVLLEARSYMATGNVAAADRLFRGTERAYRHTYVNHPMHWVQYRSYWVDGLIRNGRTRDALSLIDEPISIARGHEPGSIHIARLTLLKARAHLELGELAACATDLEYFTNFAGEEPGWSDLASYDATLCRLRLARADTAAALDAASAGLSRMRDVLAGLDGGPQGYLWLSTHDELREVLRDVFAESPEPGYGVEVLWSRLAGHLGADGLTETTSEDSRPLKKRIEAAAETRFAPPAGSYDRIRLLFAETERGWQRHVVQASDIEVSTLAVEPEHLRVLVQRCWRAMQEASAKSADRLPGDLLADLGELSQLLLPNRLRFGGSVDVVEICAEGLLAALPFEALHVGGGDAYHPLILDADVSYFRPVLPRKRRRVDGDALLFVNESCDALAPGSRSLDAAQSEGDRVATLMSGTVKLCGTDATRDNILAEWENHRVVYAAAHIARDPDVPFLTMLPTQSAPGDETATPFIAMVDVRDADFSGCDLVVLSGCSSGAPYLSGDAAAPGFGDAFLDAGAAAVVQTFWDVRDDNAAATMTAFVAERENMGGDTISALCNVKRKMTADNIHPSHWAPFYVKVGLP